MLCQHGRGVVCLECHDTIRRLCVDLNEAHRKLFEIARLRAELAEVERERDGANLVVAHAQALAVSAQQERDAAIRERDARPEISRSIAERIATWMDAERMEAIDAPTVTPAWVTEAIDALRAHAARAANGDANG